MMKAMEKLEQETDIIHLIRKRRSYWQTLKLMIGEGTLAENF